jgi:hypothetical protein
MHRGNLTVVPADCGRQRQHPPAGHGSHGYKQAGQRRGDPFAKSATRTAIEVCDWPETEVLKRPLFWSLLGEKQNQLRHRKVKRLTQMRHGYFLLGKLALALGPVLFGKDEVLKLGENGASRIVQ